jgi:hypothetical protein
MLKPQNAMLKAEIKILRGVSEKNKPWRPGPPDKTIKTIKMGLNPKDLKIGGSSKWNDKPQKGNGDHAEYLGAERRQLSFEMLLDGVEMQTPEELQADVDLLFACLAAREETKRNKNPAPSFVQLAWGATNFTGTLQKLDVTYTMFDANGGPLRAKCSLSVREYVAAAAKQNPTSGAIRSYQRRQVERGQSLAHIADEEYGVPTFWRAIAAFNGIDDPMRVRPGSVVLLPDRSDVQELMS